MARHSVLQPAAPTSTGWSEVARQATPSSELAIEVSIDELILINNALNEITNGMDVSEFSIRLGATLEEALKLQSDIRGLLRGVLGA